nr:hypothetical protein [uncultured Butyrivibrio sp.]
MDSQNNASKSSSLKILLIVGIVVILALVGVIVFLLLPKEKEPEQRRSVVINEQNAEEVVEEMVTAAEKPAEVSYYAVTQNSEWHFKDGKSETYDAYIENSGANSTDVYFDLFLKSDEENAIYESPVIPIGGHLENFKLDKELEPGTYDCVMIYHLIDDKQNTLSTLRVTATIIVEG